MSKHTYSFLEQAAARWGSSTAILEKDRKISFKQLHESALHLGSELKTLANAQGKGIAFVCGNSSRFVSGLFGCIKAGAVAMPVLPGTHGNEIEKLLQESSINIILAEKGSRFAFSIPIIKVSVDDEFDLYTFPELIPRNIELVFPGAAFIRPSSGTTGNSKGVVISHLAVFERTAAANEGLLLDENTRMLWVLPMSFHFIVSVLLYVRYGVCMIITDHFTASEIVNKANKFHATHLYASPLHYRLLAAEKSEIKFESLQTAISTSALLEPSVSKIFFEKYAIRASQAYGIIEIGLPFINHESENKYSESIGHALPAYTAAILDGNFQEVPSGIQGAFAIKGPGMFSGYLWPVQKMEDVLINGWFLTGDIAEMDSDGFVFIKGRSKSMINVSGNKVFPEEVESILKMHEVVEDARVFGGSHPVTGELVEADIVLKPNATGNAEELITHCREYLVPYKIPQRIYFVDQIQKTKTGKISRA
ncbi:long-chain-fatty-acid--CoA ligase FadD [soil metagenome]